MPELEGRMLRLLNKKKGRIAAHEEALNAFEAGGDAMDGPISPMRERSDDEESGNGDDGGEGGGGPSGGGGAGASAAGGSEDAGASAGESGRDDDLDLLDLL